MSILSWARRKLSLTDASGWAYWGGGSYSGKTVTIDTALTLSTAMSCVRLIAETIGTLPALLYQRGSDGGREVARDHPLYPVLHDSPNADQTAVEFWEGEIAKLCLVGNAVSLKEQRADGSVISLEPLPPQNVSWRVTQDGEILYALKDRGKIETDIPASKVFHIKGFGMDRFCGLSPISYARHTLGAAMAADETAGRFLGKGLNLSGFVKTGGATLDRTKGQDEQWQKTLDKFMGSENAGKLMTLEGNFDFVPMVMPAKDAQLLESRRFSVEEMCRIFRVPPILIGHAADGQTMWGSGVEQIMLAWLTTGLRTFLVRTEAAINKRLLLPGDRPRFYSEFNVEGLLRADTKTRAEFWASVLQNGLYDRAEARAKENLPFKPGSDKLTVQSNLVPLDQLGAAQTPANTLKSALRAFLTDEAA